LVPACANLLSHLFYFFRQIDYDKLPVFDLFSGKPSESAVVLELHGGSVPKGATTIVHSSNSKTINGPALRDVMTVLKEHSVKFDSKSLTINAEENDTQLRNWLKQQKQRPVIILHHDTSAPRRLTSSNNSKY